MNYQDKISIVHYAEAEVYGGTLEALYLLAGKQAEEGCDVCVILPASDSLSAFYKKLSSKNIKFLLMPAASGPMGYALSFMRLFSGADILHIHRHISFSGILTVFAAKIKGAAKIIATEQFYAVEIQSPALRLLKYISAFLCFRVIAVSGDVRRSIIAKHHAPAFKVGIISNGVETGRFAGAEIDQRLLALAGAEQGDFIIVSVSSVEHRKGCYRLVSLAGELLKCGLKFKIIVAGSGPDLEKMRDLAKASGAGSKVIFTGYLEGTERLYASGSLFILLSDREGMPLSVLEAMAAGLPVVVSDFEGAKEQVVEGETGYIVDRNDIRYAAKKIEFLAGNAPALSSMAAGAKKRSEIFDIKKIWGLYRDLYLQK